MRRSLLVLPFLACACATPQSEVGRSDPAPDIFSTSTTTTFRVAGDLAPSSRTVNAPVDRVWAVLPTVYQELGIPVDMHVPDARQIGSQRLRQARAGGYAVADLLRCANEGTGPTSVERLRYQLSVVTSLLPAPDGKTHVSTQVTGFGTPVDGSSRQNVQCVSTGLLEQRIAEAVAGLV